MTFAITAEKREAGKADAVRQSGRIPAVMYGPEIKPVVLAVDAKSFVKLYNEAGESTLIDFTIEGSDATSKVLIQDVQHDPVRQVITHVDFRQINMSEEMDVTIELTFVGAAPAVKELGGTLMTTLQEVNVRCLPSDLVSDIEVDLSVLKTIDDVISIGDLKLPKGITVTDNPETMIAKVAPALTEDQLKAMEEAAPTKIEDVEVEKKGKKEEEGEGEGDAKK